MYAQETQTSTPQTSSTEKNIIAKLDAPTTALLGQKIKIRWRGPTQQHDSITLVKDDAKDNDPALVSIKIGGQKKTAVLQLPDSTGNFELRYVNTQTNLIIGRHPLTIHPVETSLDAPIEASAKTPITVHWKGPGNDYDQISLHSTESADNSKAIISSTILERKNPISLRLPNQTGLFELRYRTAQSKSVLARRPLTILAAGRLSVNYKQQENDYHLAHSRYHGNGAMEVILDASGSMLKRQGNSRRIDIARSALSSLVSDHLANDRGFALRVYGHRESDSCRSDLEIPLGALHRETILSQIKNINAMNLAKTPIAASLEKVPIDLAGSKGPKTIALLTDGEDTCGGDPATAIRSLVESNLDVQISIIGFAIEDSLLRKKFKQWAKIGSGAYFDASSTEELLQALRRIASGSFIVRNAEKEIFAQGIIGTAPIVLPVGVYSVETKSKEPLSTKNIVIEADSLTEVTL